VYEHYKIKNNPTKKSKKSFSQEEWQDFLAVEDNEEQILFDCKYR
jgi:hypothetical protein